MLDKPDLVIKEVDNHNRVCSAGHIAPELFRNPDTGLEEPTRFFQVAGQNINGIYCELCLCIVNYVIQQNKKGK